MAKIGVSTEILDGNLNRRVTLPEDVVICVSRAVSGPSNDIYTVSDTDAANRIFGSSSPIIQLMNGALAGGAPSVALYRIGGGQAKVENLFGEYTALRTTDASVRADAELKVYSGVLEGNTEFSVFVVYRNGKIVYSNLPGREINSGVVTLDGFDPNNFGYVIGSATAPVSFKEIPAQIANKSVQTFDKTDGINSEYTITQAGSTVIQVIKYNMNTDTSVVLKAIADYSIITNKVKLTVDLLDGESLQVVYSYRGQDSDYADIVYVEGKDSLGANLNEMYELYDTALMELEMYDVAGIVIDDLHNVPNSVDNSIDKTKDHLSFVIRTEDEEGYVYEWSEFKYIFQAATGAGSTTTDPSKAALDATGSPIILKQFNEVDFVHRLGVWCYTQSDIGHFVIGCAGTAPPKSAYSLAINRWIGKEPTKDIYGNIIENGTGLLGNRFVSGTTTRSAGFWMTDTGYPDGNIRKDSGGYNVDLGKYLSLPILPVTLPTIRSTSVRSSAAIYAGMLPRVTPGDSTTNMLVPAGITPMFKLKSDKIQKLTNAGYVVLEEKEDGLYVYSGVVPTVASDYKFVSTGIAVAQTLKRVRRASNPYIGKGTNVDIFTSLFNAIDSSLKESVTLGYINGYDFNLLQDAMNELSVPIILAPKHELQAVKTLISLTDQDYYNSGNSTGGNV